MASGKYDIIWSPLDTSEFITYGSDISLYRIESNIEHCHLEQHSRVRQISDNTYAVHLATNTDVSLIKCVAWYPRTDYPNLLAVGQANGHVVLTSIGSNVSNDLTGKEFALKHNRQCNYVAWNPSEPNLFAQGFEKHKNDPCLAIWDTNYSHAISDYHSSDRSRYSYSEPGLITKAAQEIGNSESSHSFAWIPSAPKAFITGVNKQLRLYDLRDTTRPHHATNHKSVFGVCIDSKFDDRIASFGDNHISIWDLRNFDKPIVTLQQTKPVIKISWCPARIGMLSVLCKDSYDVSLYDIKHSVSGSDDIEPVIRERNIEAKGQKSVISSFSWHPCEENRLLTFTGPDIIHEIFVFEKITMQWSSQLKLTLASGKKAEEYEINVDDYVDDISFKIKDRIKHGYGSFIENETIGENGRIVKDEPSLKGVWDWIRSVRNLLKNNESRSNVTEFLGVKGLLRFPDNLDMSSKGPSDYFVKNWSDSTEQTLAVFVYESEERFQALDLCGWGRSDNSSIRSHYIESNFHRGNCAKAAAIALFSRRIRTALEFLSKYSQEDSAIYKTVAIAIAGVSDKTALWKKTCNDLRYQLKQPYLRGMFAFLVAENNNFHDILYDDQMDVKDRVAFACIYLSDDKLHKYFDDLVGQLKVPGDLNGLLLTGFTSEGIELIERYVDLSNDIQTAALISIFCFPNSLERYELDKVSVWIEGYRSLLDQWQLYHVRAKFDINRNKFNPDNISAPKVQVRCNFCNKSINNTNAMQMPRSRLPPGISSHAIHKPKTCPHCRKSLPRCSVCLNNLGTASGMNHVQSKDHNKKLTPLSDWFTWCQSCRHGGHASHITTWFSTHSECPVTGCSCKCQVDNRKGKLQKASDNPKK